MNEYKLNNILNHYINFEVLDFLAKQQYIDLYDSYEEKIRPYFIYFHQRLDELLKYMNDRVKTGYYTANESRELINLIERINELKNLLKSTKYSFSLDPDYQESIDICQKFLSYSGGSEIPKEYKKLEIKRYEPIFKINERLIIKHNQLSFERIDLKLIGEGAYAKVFSFKEPLTKKRFAMKRLNKEIIGKEFERFKLEYEKMSNISNPYILKAYSYNENENSYIMEYCDYTLREYISKNNNQSFMDFNYRKKIAFQFLNGLNYLHSKGLYHRDISLNNVLIQEYDDNVIVIKLSDFGLIKDANSQLTRTDSEIRGTIIDDTLKSFKDYNIKNEIYAIGVVLWFIFTGKTNLNIDNSNIGRLVNKCIIRNHDERFNNVTEIIQSLSNIFSYETEETPESLISNNIESNIKVFKIKNDYDIRIDDRGFTILKAMVEDESDNQIFYIKTLNGETYQTSDGKFNLNLFKFSPRERSYWKSSFESLIANGFIKSVNYKNEIFEVTAQGYEFYDLQKEYISVV